MLPLPLLATLLAVGADMVAIPAGRYRPLYGRPGDAPTAVAAFHLDRDPVTRGAFLDFVRANPQWRRGAVRPELADAGYLGDWRADLVAGDATDRRRPVTGVSWFAARAYCAWRGRRLPTVHEWEYAAAASATHRDAAREPAFAAHVLALYARRPRPLPPLPTADANAYGVRGLHGLAWEWTADFDGARAAAPTDAHAHAPDPSCAGAAIGATDPRDYPAFLRHAVRAGLTARSTGGTLGLRCAA